MTNLRRSKAELYDIVDRIIKMFEEDHLTTQEIEYRLRNEGYNISREAIRRTVKKNRTIAKELAKARSETEVLIDTIRSNPATDVNEATTDFLIAKSFEFVKTIESVDFDDLPELAKFIKDITKIKTDIVKQRMNYQQVYNRAKADILNELQKALEKNPDVFNSIFELISHMEAPCE